MRLFYHLGRYYILMSKVFAKPERYGMYYRQTMRELEYQGINSIGIVVIISIFVGAVITMQTNYNIENPSAFLLQIN